MIKVIVVEDKPPILRSIKQKIANYSSEINVVGEAINGQLALPVINLLKPDIVFTDIKMPVMDGLKLISEAKKINSNLHYIIISGYDEFEYARQAMKLGVSEYLLKPVSQEAINEVLDKTVNTIKAQKYDLEKNLLSNILNSGSNKQHVLNYNLDHQNFIIALLCAGSYSNIVIDYANPLNSFWSVVDLDSIVKKYISRDASLWSFEGKNFNEIILVLGFNENNEIDVKHLADSINQELIIYNVPVTVVASQKVINVNDIGIETQHIRALLRKTLIFGKSKVFLRDKPYITSIVEDSILDTSLEKKLVTFVQGNQRKLFNKEILSLMCCWETNNFTQNTIEKLLKQIIKACQKACFKQTGIYSDMELEIDELLSISKDYIALSQGVMYIFDRFFPDQVNVDQKGESIKQIVGGVENYLKTHFAEQITINSIADMVKLDPSYLGRIFKNLKGVSPMEYLTNLRIEKAKELILSEPRLMLKDVAEIVGYSDQFYFSRIFKIITGTTPSEYKNSNIRQ